MALGKWILLEPYYGGSHRQLVDGLVQRLPCELELWTLPPRKWKWRLRGAALHFAARWQRQRPAALRGLLPAEARSIPIIIYFHENQLHYPVQVEDKRDYHYGWTNIQSALAADRVLWNSRFNRDSFLEALGDFLPRLPDARLEGLAEAIAARSEILPVPLDLRAAPAPSRQERADAGRRPCRLVWNHRWEHDKGPEILFEALLRLAGEGLAFELAVLGQRFAAEPAVFAAARAGLSEHIVAWGPIADRGDYLKELARCDLALSTARHEFQGLAVLEAAACGALPLVPDALAYREIWPAECRYPPADFCGALRQRLLDPAAWRGRDCRSIAMHYDWCSQLPRWTALFASFA